MDTAGAEVSAASEGTAVVKRAHPRVTVTGVLGEVLITVGVVVLLFVVWQLWIGDLIAGAQNNDRGHSISEEWEALVPTAPTAAPDPTEDPEEIPVLPEAGDGEIFGVMHIPRFGSDYAVPMAGGVSRATTLDPIGIGHYPGTQMPGAVGNTAYAAHRTGYGGAPFYRIGELRVGDAIVIETEDGWYTYRFRNLEYVKPTAGAVLNEVPQDVSPPDGERYLTLTSCSPKHTIIERIVAYAAFDSFQPRADGPPATLSTTAAPSGDIAEAGA